MQARARRGGIAGFLVVWIVAVFTITWGATPLHAHEPLFGVGPHTVYQNGLGLETELEVEEGETAVRAEAIYGVTSDLAVTLAVPWVRRTAGNISGSGLGDIGLRAKWRFYRRDFPGGQDAVALVVGGKFPTGNDGAAISRGTGSTDLVAGLAAGRESRRWYYFGDLRYRLNTRGKGLKRGNVLFYDAAWGVRPVRTRYEKPDLVLLVEANGKVVGKADRDGAPNPDTGGNLFSISPGFLFSIRNLMLKGGVNLPVAWDLNGRQEDPGTQVVLGLEFHL